MKVYGVWSGYEDMDGIFSTAVKAQEYINKYIQKWHTNKDRFGIVEYDVDTASDYLDKC